MNQVRSIFVSDIHLGSKHTQAGAFLSFLEEQEPEYLYLVGDVVDGWKLRKNWYWTETFNAIIQRIIDLGRRGTKVFYTPGNHDEFLRGFLPYNLAGIQVRDEFIHQTANDQRFLVMHGDRFDEVEKRAKWLSKLGDVGYDVLLRVNRNLNAIRRRLGLQYWAISRAAKTKVKQFTNFLSDFERMIVEYARSRECHGIICGHVHLPRICERNGVMYCNTGDWVEHCSALVEYRTGALEIVHRPSTPVVEPASLAAIGSVLSPLAAFRMFLPASR